MFQSRIVIVCATGLAWFVLGAVFAAPPKSAPKKKGGDGFVATKPADKDAQSNSDDDDTKKVVKTDKEWMKILTREQFRVARKSGAERPYTGKLWNNTRDGVYECVCCGRPLFDSSEKIDARNGYPTFKGPIDEKRITIDDENKKIECSRCEANLGQLLDGAGTQPGGALPGAALPGGAVPPGTGVPPAGTLPPGGVPPIGAPPAPGAGNAGTNPPPAGTPPAPGGANPGAAPPAGGANPAGAGKTGASPPAGATPPGGTPPAGGGGKPGTPMPPNGAPAVPPGAPPGATPPGAPPGTTPPSGAAPPGGAVPPPAGPMPPPGATPPPGGAIPGVPPGGGGQPAEKRYCLNNQSVKFVPRAEFDKTRKKK